MAFVIKSEKVTAVTVNKLLIKPTPGPGHYLELKKFHTNSNAFSFNSTEKRFKNKTPGEINTPGVGEYDLLKAKETKIIKQTTIDKNKLNLDQLSLKKNKLNNLLEEQALIENLKSINTKAKDKNTFNKLKSSILLLSRNESNLKHLMQNNKDNGRLILELQKDNNSKITVSERKTAFEKIPFLVTSKRFINKEVDIIDTPGPGNYEKEFFLDKQKDKSKMQRSNSLQRNSRIRKPSENSKTQNQSMISDDRRFRNAATQNEEASSHSNLNNCKPNNFFIETRQMPPQSKNWKNKTFFKDSEIPSVNSIPFRDSCFGYYENPFDKEQKQMIAINDPYKKFKNNVSPWSYNLFEIDNKKWVKKGGDLWSKSNIPKTATEITSESTLRKHRLLNHKENTESEKEESVVNFLQDNSSLLNFKNNRKIFNRTFNNPERFAKNSHNIKLRLESVGVIVTDQESQRIINLNKTTDYNNSSVDKRPKTSNDLLIHNIQTKIHHDHQISSVKCSVMNSVNKQNKIRAVYNKISSNMRQQRQNFDHENTTDKAKELVKVLLDKVSKVTPGPGYYMDDLAKYSMFQPKSLEEEKQCFGCQTSRFKKAMENKTEESLGPGCFYKETTFIKPNYLKKLQREAKERKTKLLELELIKNNKERLGIVDFDHQNKPNKKTATSKANNNKLNSRIIDYSQQGGEIGFCNDQPNDELGLNYSKLVDFQQDSRPGPGCYELCKDFFKKSFNSGDTFKFGSSEVRFKYSKKKAKNNNAKVLNATFDYTSERLQSKTGLIDGDDYYIGSEKSLKLRKMERDNDFENGFFGSSLKNLQKNKNYRKILGKTRRKLSGEDFSSKKNDIGRLKVLLNQDSLNTPSVGQYNLSDGFDIAKRIEKIYEQNSFSKPFNSTSIRFKKPKESTIGPGRYIKNVINKQKVFNNTLSAFNTNEKRFDRSFARINLNNTIGPGSYGHNSYFDWNKKTFNILYL